MLARRRADGLLGQRIAARHSFDFDIRIQMGAGAYVCGEESALLNSCEGLRGDPRNRPPFPAQRGYLGFPTVVNNVETLACVTRILEAGPATFSEFGTKQSAGTKLLSISGDVGRAGVYEVPFGVTLREVLAMAGGRDATAIQLGGPSGRMLGPDDFDRTICYDDLATGGALVVFGPGRNPIEIARMYMEFFEDESCGYCTPCRVGNVLLRQGLERVLDGRGEPSDLEQFEAIAQTMKATSRCGLGQTSFNPVLTSLASFRPLYESLVQEHPQRFRRSFDLEARDRRGGAGFAREALDEREHVSSPWMAGRSRPRRARPSSRRPTPPGSTSRGCATSRGSRRSAAAASARSRSTAAASPPAPTRSARAWSWRATPTS